MMNPKSKHPITVEDLLRFKRAERPPAEFWVQFDRELREKQLAALVQKEPWWRSLPKRLRGLTRYHLPIGATAVLAVTLLSIRDYEPVRSAVAVTASIEDPQEIAVIGGAASRQDTFELEDYSNEEVAAPAPAPVLGSETSTPGELARMVPMLPLFGSQESELDLPPSARSIAENRAAAEALLGHATSGFETRALPVRVQPQEPLEQISNPSETRRARFATAYAAAALGTSPVPTARVARRLSDEQLYDSIHRFGASGNSLSIKF